jgi:hypothetical protein
MITENRLKKAQKQLEEKWQQEAGVVVLWNPHDITEQQKAAIRQGANVIKVIWETFNPAHAERQLLEYRELLDSIRAASL